MSDATNSLYQNKIVELMGNLYSKEGILKYQSYEINTDEVQLIQKAAREVLSRFPYASYQCAPMSALWVAVIRNNTTIPAHVIAGSLDFKGKRLFGNNKEATNFDELFSSGNPLWDGHCWAMFGNCIGEISLFRTAYSNVSPLWLRTMIIESFGENRGLILGEPHSMEKMGFQYYPEYLLNDLQMTGLVNAAYVSIEKAMQVF